MLKLHLQVEFEHYRSNTW